MNRWQAQLISKHIQQAPQPFYPKILEKKQIFKTFWNSSWVGTTWLLEGTSFQRAGAGTEKAQILSSNRKQCLLEERRICQSCLLLSLGKHHGKQAILQIIMSYAMEGFISNNRNLEQPPEAYCQLEQLTKQGYLIGILRNAHHCLRHQF